LDAELICLALPFNVYNEKAPENLQRRLINLQWDDNLETRKK